MNTSVLCWNKFSSIIQPSLKNSRANRKTFHPSFVRVNVCFTHSSFVFLLYVYNFLYFFSRECFCCELVRFFHFQFSHLFISYSKKNNLLIFLVTLVQLIFSRRVIVPFLFHPSLSEHSRLTQNKRLWISSLFRFVSFVFSPVVCVYILYKRK